MSDIFLTLASVTVVALIASFSSVKLKLPPVIGLILIGMLFGPHGLGFVKDAEIINVFAEIGSILLLFLIGTEFSLSKIKKLGLSSIIVAITELGTVFMVSYEACQFLGFSPGAAIFIAITLSITSTALTVKLLQEMGMGDRNEVPLLVGVSIIEDIFAIFALAFISSLAIGKSFTLMDISFSIAKALLIFTASFLIISKSLSFLIKRIEVSKETIMLIGFSLVMGMSFVSVWMGFSAAIGAFLAGSITSSLPRGKEFEESTKHFSLLFISLFFLSIGMMGNPRTIVSNMNLILIFMVIAMSGKFIGISLGTFFAGYPGRSSVFSGLAMLPIGEISLLIAKSGVDAGILEPTFMGIMAMLVILTSLFSYPGIINNEKVYNFLDRIIPSKIKRIGINLARIFTLYRTQLGPEGRLYKVVISSFRKIFFYTMIGSFFIVLLIFTRMYIANDALFVSLLILSIAPFYFALVNIERMIGKFSDVLMRLRSQAGEKKRIKTGYIQVIVLLIFAFFVSPLIGVFIDIPYISVILSSASIATAIIILSSLSARFQDLKDKFRRRYRFRHRR